MKNIFSINVDNDKYLADDFIARKVSEEIKDKQDAVNQDVSDLQKKSQLPKAFSIILYVVFFIAAIATCGFFGGLSKVSFKTAMDNAGFILYIAIVAWVVVVVLFIISRLNLKKVLNSTELVDVNNDAESVLNETLSYLQIPDDALKVDFFSEVYKVKKGKEINYNKVSKYINVQLYAFIEGDNLMLGDLESVISIPLDYITGIEEINKKTSFVQWNKDEGPNQGEFKKYKITESNFSFFIKPYYIIKFNNGIKDYEMVIPAYEYEHMSHLINIKYE